MSADDDSAPSRLRCLWMASWVGGASVIGSAGRAHNLGITAVWYCLALAIGCFIFAALFAAKVKRIGDAGQYLTYPDLIEDRFDGRTRLIATITTALSFIAFAAGQLAASAAIIEVIFGWSFAQSLLLATSIVVAYTAIGGFLAITYTDWLQIILLVLGVVVIGLPIAILNGGTPDNLLSNLPPERFDLGAWGWPAIIALVVSISMSFIVSMDSFTRSYSAKSPSAARNGPFLAVILIIIIAWRRDLDRLDCRITVSGRCQWRQCATAVYRATLPNRSKGAGVGGLVGSRHVNGRHLYLDRLGQHHP